MIITAAIQVSEAIVNPPCANDMGFIYDSFRGLVRINMFPFYSHLICAVAVES